MTTRILRLVAAAGAAAATLGAAPAAHAAPVYGGTTRVGDAIVLNAAADGAGLKSAVLSWHADCGASGRFSESGLYTLVKAQAGFMPGPRELTAAKNAKGTFAAVGLAIEDLGDQIAAIRLDFKGKLKPGQASGTLSVDIALTDKATNTLAGSCKSGNVSWRATHAPGTVYGGKTSQDQPVVVRVSGREIDDLLIGWRTHTCADPTASYSIPDHLGNISLGSRGGFKGAFSAPVTFNDGTKRTYSYVLTGQVGATTAKGRIEVKFTDTDGTGAQVASCDTGAVTWKAVTG